MEETTLIASESKYLIIVFKANMLDCCFPFLLQISTHSPQTPSCFCQFCSH